MAAAIREAEPAHRGEVCCEPCGQQTVFHDLEGEDAGSDQRGRQVGKPRIERWLRAAVASRQDPHHHQLLGFIDADASACPVRRQRHHHDLDKAVCDGKGERGVEWTGLVVAKPVGPFL
ncbi:hypothetical protein [Mesorhizobium sp.]|uniref:hypothetical protein n=1 Tax=Mesorhizobium sp. TaxID=1871066 RepID=UPI0025C17B6E|nr:hypothetical protein [Mesorhizobium sp.]